MKLRVDLCPQAVSPQTASNYEDVVVLVDVLRTCTIAPMLFDNGLRHLYLTSSLRIARSVAKEKDFLLIGERDGLPPEGFNYLSSPSSVQNLNMTDKAAVVVTANAPKALSKISAKHVLLASLYNARAVVKRVKALASKEIAIVCAGHEGQEALDDALVAGYLAAELAQAESYEYVGAFGFCNSLLKAFPDPLEALWHSRAGQALRQVQEEDDIAIASSLSLSSSVPELTETINDEHAKLFRFEVF